MFGIGQRLWVGWGIAKQTYYDKVMDGVSGSVMTELFWFYISGTIIMLPSQMVKFLCHYK